MADNRLYLADTFNKEYIYFIKDSVSGIFIKDLDKLERFLSSLGVTNYLIMVKESDNNSLFRDVRDNYDEFE